MAVVAAAEWNGKRQRKRKRKFTAAVIDVLLSETKSRIGDEAAERQLN